MRKNILFAIVLSLAMAGCGGVTTHNINLQENNENNTEATEEAKTDLEKAIEASDFPWYFPEEAKNEGLAEGQTVLSIHSFYPDKLKESNDPAEETYIFYNATLKSIGEKSSVVFPVPIATETTPLAFVAVWCVSLYTASPLAVTSCICNVITRFATISFSALRINA